MKKTLSYFLYTLLLAATVCACSSDIDIKQDYGYGVETLPLPKTLKQGQSVDLEFSIIREGFYENAAYKFRYFQSSGEGILTDKGRTVPMNRFQDIRSDEFVLVYTCASEEQQQLDFLFEDNFGKRVEYTIAFSSKRTDEEADSDFDVRR